MHEGLVSTRLGLKGIPSAAEEIHVARDIILAELTGGHVHLCHMSTRGSVATDPPGQGRGTARDRRSDAAPLHADARALRRVRHAGQDEPAAARSGRRGADPAGRSPTARSTASRRDHAPHHYDAKEREFDDAPNGIIGLETALSLAWRELVGPGLLTLATLIDRMSSAPARIWRLPGGTLRRREPADVVVFDPEATVDGRPVSAAVAVAQYTVRRRGTPGRGAVDPGRGPAGPTGAAFRRPLRPFVAVRSRFRPGAGRPVPDSRAQCHDRLRPRSRRRRTAAR